MFGSNLILITENDYSFLGMNEQSDPKRTFRPHWVSVCVLIRLQTNFPIVLPTYHHSNPLGWRPPLPSLANQARPIPPMFLSFLFLFKIYLFILSIYTFIK